MKPFLLLFLLFVQSLVGIAQTFDNVYDFDSTNDCGWHILLKPDGSYFIMGDAQVFNAQDKVMDMTVSADGSTAYNKHVFPFWQSNNYSGKPGSLKATGNGYIAPFTVQLFPPWGGFLRSFSGLLKLKPNGDTVFLRTYTDTSTQFDYSYDCAVLNNGDYLLGYTRTGNPDTNGYLPDTCILMLTRTDSNGNVVWTCSFKKYLNQSTELSRLDTLSGGKILIGAVSRYSETNNGFTYSHNTPWFIILDSAGNIIKDTVYPHRYAGGGWIAKDINGGYYHRGCIDSILVPNANFPGNFPQYLAHLDTNFVLDWITMFPFSEYFQGRYPQTVRQSPIDSSYVIAGDLWLDYTGWTRAWGAKVSKDGHLIWNHQYSVDTNSESYFRDLAIRPDGSIIFCGAGHSDTMGYWHAFKDVWLVSVDSNGCLQPGCSPDTTDPDLIIVPLTHPQSAFSVYPNPVTDGSFTVQSSSAGKVYIVDMQGRRMATYQAAVGQTHLRLPQGIVPGTYICVLQPDDGSGEEVVHLIYE